MFCFRCSLAQSSNSTLVVSEDGNCGGTTGQTCLGSSFGNCCSGKGYCGSTADYCNAECQSEFGLCVTNATTISSDGRCGSTDPSSQICIGSSFGSCCSEKGWCGSADDYCGTGCQGDFGQCNGTNIVVVVSSAQTTSTPSTSSVAPGLTSSTISSETGMAPTAPASEKPTTSKISTGAKAGVGVGVAAAGVGIIGAVVFLFSRRQARKRTSESDENVESEDRSHKNMSSAAPSSHSGLDKGAFVNENELPAMPMPAELGNQRASRSELGAEVHGPASELDSEGGRREVTDVKT